MRISIGRKTSFYRSHGLMKPLSVGTHYGTLRVLYRRSGTICIPTQERGNDERK